MAKAWVTVVGIGEDGPDGLPPASRAALAAADVVMAPPRHLSLLPDGLTDARRIEWPVPFAAGLDTLPALRGQQVVVLASGDPFWFGAGRAIAERLTPGEWRVLPAPSVFSLAAARLGWPIETTVCLGLHAQPLSRLRPYLAPGQRLIATVRDGKAVDDLAAYVCETGFGDSRLTVLEALGGPRERIRHRAATEAGSEPAEHPVAVAVEARGDGVPLQRAPGHPDDRFDTDGQITKAPIRAMTLAALAPRHGQRLWDIGGGSGSVAIEWLLCDPSTEAATVEARADRAERIRKNARDFGVERLEVIEGRAPGVLPDGPPPDAVFVGGGLDEALFSALETRLPPGTRIVANAVTLEGEAMLAERHARLGGTLTRIELSRATPLGPKRGWTAAYPVVQWSGTL